MRVAFGILFSFLVSIVPNVTQAEPAAVAEADAGKPAQTLRKISITATRGEREIDRVAGTVTIIDASEIRDRMANDIKDLVRYEPGISVASSAARFGLAGFNIRGIDANRVLMRVDGVPMAEAFSIGSFSDARRNLIDLEAVKSVEIVRGASSALYGSDAIGGVVSFVMKDPDDYLYGDRNAYIGVRSGFQSDDDGWFSSATLATSGERMSAMLIYTHRAGHETANRGTLAANDRSRTKPNPQDYDSDAVLAKVVWNVVDGQELKLTLEADRTGTATEVLSAVGAAGAVETTSMYGDDEQRRWRASIGHEIAANGAFLFDRAHWMAYAQRSRAQQDTREQRHALAAGPGESVQRDRRFEFEQESIGAELTLYKAFSTGSVDHLLTYGIDASRTRTEQLRDGVQTHLASGAATRLIPPDAFPVRDFPLSETLEYAFYIQDEIDLAQGRLSLVPGVRVDRYRLRPEVDRTFAEDNPGVEVQRITRTSTAPKLGLIAPLGERHAVFAQYARGFRAPPYNDVNIGFTNLAFGYTAMANPDLQPETSDGYEIGLRGNFEGASFELAAFYNEYEDFIESLVAGGMQDGLLVFQSQNLARANIRGAELKGALDLGSVAPSLHNWTVRSSIAWARGEDRVSDRPLNSVDPLKAVLGIGYAPAEAAWGIDLIATAVDRHSHADDDAGALFIPAGYFTLDLTLRAMFAERWEVNAGVFNLTDQKYWEWADVRGRSADDAALDRYTRPGINASAAVTFRF